MLRKGLSFMLAILIVFQSISAIADAHQFHQAGTEHLEFNHDHALVSIEEVSGDYQPLNALADSQFDCHHCCHCHTATQVFLAASRHFVDVRPFGQRMFEYHLTFLSHSISPDLRPPIV